MISVINDYDLQSVIIHS